VFTKKCDERDWYVMLIDGFMNDDWFKSG